MDKKRTRRGMFESLVRAHAAELYRYAYWFTTQAESAEDLVQEAFFEAWRAIGSLRDPDRARAWLFQILRYRCAHWARDRKRRPRAEFTLEEMAETPDLHLQDPHSRIVETIQLERALVSLDERYREPFLMVFLCGFSCSETAGILGIPLGTVLSRIHRGRLALRKGLLGLSPPRVVPADGRAGRRSLRLFGEDHHETE
jgi:RNA polymerase sigma-70 factor (ECF subfamily)